MSHIPPHLSTLSDLLAKYTQVKLHYSSLLINTTFFHLNSKDPESSKAFYMLCECLKWFCSLQLTSKDLLNVIETLSQIQVESG